MEKLANLLIDIDLTWLFVVLVFFSVIMSIALMSAMLRDPANDKVSIWQIRARRAGMVLIELGLLADLLIMIDRSWYPWPSMVLVVCGLNAFYASALHSVFFRIKACPRWLHSDPSRDATFWQRRAA